VRQPSGQQTVLMSPLGAVGVVRGEGRLWENIEPSEQPERLIKMKVTDVTAALLVQQLQGQQTQQRTRGWDHARAGIISFGNELVESDTRQKRQEEENPCDPRAQAASRRQRDTTHISDERIVWTDDGGPGVLTGRKGAHAARS